MTAELAPPPIDGTWSSVIGPWSAPRHRRSVEVKNLEDVMAEVLQAAAPLLQQLTDAAREASVLLDLHFERWAIAQLDAVERHQLLHHGPEHPHRSEMHRRYAHRRRSRRPARRTR